MMHELDMMWTAAIAFAVPAAGALAYYIKQQIKKSKNEVKDDHRLTMLEKKVFKEIDTARETHRNMYETDKDIYIRLNNIDKNLVKLATQMEFVIKHCNGKKNQLKSLG